MDNELKSISSANGQNGPLQAAITLRVADSKSLRPILAGAASESKAQAQAFVKLLKQIH